MHFKYKTVLYQTIQFSISTQFSSIWPIDRTLSGAATPDENGHGSDDSEGVPCIFQNSNITETSLSDCLVSYPVHLLGGGGLTPRQRSSCVFYSPNQLGKHIFNTKVTIVHNYYIKIPFTFM